MPVRRSKIIDRRFYDGTCGFPRMGRCLSAALLMLLLGLIELLLPPAGRATIAGPQECANESLRSALNLTLLSDCRAYEMVTPTYKEGYPLFVESVASNGDSAIVAGLATLSGSAGSSERVETGSVYLDTRTSDGWRLTPMNAPLSQYAGEYLESAEGDRDETLWVQHTLEQPATNRGLYVRSSTGVFSFVGPDNPPGVIEKDSEPSDTTGLAYGEYDPVRATTDDYGHLVLETQIEQPQERWPFDHTTGSRALSLYEYSGTNNKEPTLVAVEGERGSRQLIALCGTTLGSGGLGSYHNSLSSDGETIFFTVNPCTPGPSTAEVYARLHGGMTGVEPAETVDISASECTTACGAKESGKNFEGASEDGNLVYFTSTQKLTNDAVDGTDGGDAFREGCAGIDAATPPDVGGCNLYLYDFSKPLGHRLTAVSVGGKVLGVAGIAENGTRVYYISRAKIDSAGTNPYGSQPSEGQPNLYAYDATNETTAFVVTLGGNDESDWSRKFGRPVQVAGQGGRFVLFASSMPSITPDDTSSVVQLYAYKAPEGPGDNEQNTEAELVRVTKGENDFNSDGNGIQTGPELASIAFGNRLLGGNLDFKSTTNRLNISADGKRVFFVTVGQLSARARSATEGCQSVYEFATPGALVEGSVHLISDGSDATPYRSIFCGVELFGIDELGDNVLFNTGDPLSMGDVDSGQRDVYDARVDGGFSSPSRGTPCGPGSCEESSSLPPALPVASSTSNAGETFDCFCPRRRKPEQGRADKEEQWGAYPSIASMQTKTSTA